MVQDEKRGTAAGVLLPLMEILRRAPDAVVTLLPSDHDALAPDDLNTATRAAEDEARARGDEIVLLGITPSEATSDYGYIVPDEDDDDRSARVARFVEKPPRDVARRLLDEGALWSSLILAARGEVLMELFAVHHPELVLGALARPRSTEKCGNVVSWDNHGIPAQDFSRHVMTPAVDRMRVVRAPRCGWSDLGTPERLAERVRERS